MFATIEQNIIDRLRKCAADPARWSGDELTIGQQSEVESVEKLRQRAPAIWVIYDGIRPLETDGQPAFGVQKVAMDFFIVGCAKSALGNGRNTAARDLAGEIENFIVESLLGFDAGEVGRGGKYLRLNESAGPSYDAGYCHIPLSFTVAVTFKGKP